MTTKQSGSPATIGSAPETNAEARPPFERSSVSERDLTEAITTERRDQVALLGALPAELWDAPTLCDGWRVREVVAHQTMPFRYSGRRFALEILKAAGKFDRMADRVARRDAASMSGGELLAALRDNVSHSWKPPGGGLSGALTHDVVHGLDITVALAINRRVPEDRVGIAVSQVTSRRRNPFGVDLQGIALHADDVDWAFGSGTPLSGAAQDLLLVLCGRKLPAGRLRGDESERFTKRTV
jgi:uncharacterized protein (TIGR03083 family)